MALPCPAKRGVEVAKAYLFPDPSQVLGIAGDFLTPKALHSKAQGRGRRGAAVVGRAPWVMIRQTRTPKAFHKNEPTAKCLV